MYKYKYKILYTCTTQLPFLTQNVNWLTAVTDMS